MSESAASQLKMAGQHMFGVSMDDLQMKSRLQATGRRMFNWVAGLAILFALWWLGGYLIYINPNTTNFADFGPVPTFEAFPVLWNQGKIQAAVMTSGFAPGVPPPPY